MNSKKNIFLFFILMGMLACHSEKQTDSQIISVERGRYLAVISGCNDCHTPGWALKPLQIPESDWLRGSDIGFQGPWGTTYPTNLRLYFSTISEESWAQFSRNVITRPPMPWWILHQFSEADARSLYRFLRKLGPVGKPVPDFVPEGQKVSTPVIEFYPKNSK